MSFNRSIFKQTVIQVCLEILLNKKKWNKLLIYAIIQMSLNYYIVLIIWFRRESCWFMPIQKCYILHESLSKTTLKWQNYRTREQVSGYQRLRTWQEGFIIMFSCLGMSDSLWPHGLQHARFLCPLSLGVCSNHVHWGYDAIQPSHPLSASSPPACNLSQNQGLFHWVGSLYQVAKVSELQLQQEEGKRRN